MMRAPLDVLLVKLELMLMVKLAHLVLKEKRALLVQLNAPIVQMELSRTTNHLQLALLVEL
jgi:hypothetical protein